MTPAACRILVLDDDVSFCAGLAEGLESDGHFTVTTANTIAQAREEQAARVAAFDAFILDVGLPDGDGRDFCASLRKLGIETPVLMLTGSDAEADVVRGLTAGANDYVAKPFRMAVLMARLRSQLREYKNSMHLMIDVGPYSFRPADKTLRDASRRRRIHLTDKEAKLLRYPCRTPDRGVARQMLLNEVWGYNERVATHTLETHVYRLRQKMGVDPSMPRLIRCDAGCYSVHPTPDFVTG